MTQDQYSLVYYFNDHAKNFASGLHVRKIIEFIYIHRKFLFNAHFLKIDLL